MRAAGVAQETAELRLKLDNSQGDVRGQLKTKDDKISEILEELASINALYNELKETTETVSGGAPIAGVHAHTERARVLHAQRCARAWLATSLREGVS